MAGNAKIRKAKKYTPCPTKELILEYAAEEFLKKGWEYSNIRDIAKKAGVTTGSIYFHFKNKEALFSALVQETYDELLMIQKKMYDDHFAIPASDIEKRRFFRLEARRNIIKYSYKHAKAVKLLLMSASGTKYDDLFDKMMEITHRADMHALIEEKIVPNNLLDININLFIRIDKTSWICLFEPIRTGIPYEQAIKYADIIDDFYEAGWYKIFKNTCCK